MFFRWKKSKKGKEFVYKGAGLNSSEKTKADMDIKRMNNQLDQIAFVEVVCLPGVNFTNILGAASSYKNYQQLLCTF